MTWRPIETAPKEKDVLIWKEGWDHPEQARLIRGWWCNDGAGHFKEPTHWRHLPEGPSEEVDRGR